MARLIYDSELSWLYEDKHHEFKMHTNMAIDDIPSHCQIFDKQKLMRTRQPISKTICAFLNSGGGRIYLGITDEGIVKGISLSDMQMDHLVLSLDDTLRCFDPPVPHGFVKMKIIPVIVNQNPLKSLADDNDGWGGSAPTIDKDRLPNEPSKYDVVHVLRGPCKRCEASVLHGMTQMVALIEIRDGGRTIYQNEEGLAYHRTIAGNKCFTVEKLRIEAETGKTASEIEKIRRSLALPSFCRL